MPWTYVIENLNGEDIVGITKMIDYVSNGKAMIIRLTVRLTKKMFLC